MQRLLALTVPVLSLLAMTVACKSGAQRQREEAALSSTDYNKQIDRAIELTSRAEPPKPDAECTKDLIVHAADPDALYRACGRAGDSSQILLKRFRDKYGPELATIKKRCPELTKSTRWDEWDAIDVYCGHPWPAFSPRPVSHAN
jgi:hypothetical protein